VARGASFSRRAPSPDERARGAVGGGPGAGACRKDTPVSCTRAHRAAPPRAGPSPCASRAARSALRAPRRGAAALSPQDDGRHTEHEPEEPERDLAVPAPGDPHVPAPSRRAQRGAGRPAAGRRGGVERARPGLGCKRRQPCRKPPRQSENAASRREPPRKPPERVGHVAARAPVVQRVGVLVFFRSQGSLPLAGHRGSVAPHQSAASLHHLMAFRRSSIESPSQTSRPVRS